MTKPNWEDITQYRCGCTIRQIRLPHDPNHLSIAWCPKHDAALEMYEVLKEMVQVFGEFWKFHSNPKAIETLKTPIIKAESILSPIEIKQ